KLTLRAACRMCVRRLKSMLRSSTLKMTSSSVIATSSALVRIGGIAQAVAEEVVGEHREDHGAGRPDQQPGRGGDGADVLCILQQHAPRDHRRLEADAEKAQRRFGD